MLLLNARFAFHLETLHRRTGCRCQPSRIIRRTDTSRLVDAFSDRTILISPLLHTFNTSSTQSLSSGSYSFLSTYSLSYDNIAVWPFLCAVFITGTCINTRCRCCISLGNWSSTPNLEIFYSFTFDELLILKKVKFGHNWTNFIRFIGSDSMCPVDFYFFYERQAYSNLIHKNRKFYQCMIHINGLFSVQQSYRIISYPSCSLLLNRLISPLIADSRSLYW